MNPRTGPNPDRPAHRRRIAALVATLALAWGGAAGASAEGAKPGHHCACAERCKGASCCCPSGTHEVEPEPEAPAETEKAAPAAPAPDGPCARSAPCGHPDLPSPASSRPIVRMAALLPVPAPMAVASTRLRATSDAPGSPSAFVARLDDPPEA